MTRQHRWQIGILTAIIVATVTFHYGFLMPGHHAGLLHAIHGRLCYIPIILGAIWFGVRGGLAVALVIIALTLPYPTMEGITNSRVLFNEYTEMVFYVAIGTTAGILIEQQRRERRRTERLQAELARKEHLSSLGQMAAGLAHEIKNPLGSIRGAAEILGDDVSADGRQRDLLDVLNKESRRLGDVVDHFLAFARPRTRQLAPTSLNDVVARVCSQIGMDASSRDVSLDARLAEDLPVIQADASQLHQVFLNVILNAVAASPGGSRIDVATRRDVGIKPGSVTVTVTDRGSGIAPENLPRVFDPFFSTRDSGTGLGLSISHAIIEDHGGDIAIESTPGRGTTVTVTLPVSGERTTT